MIMSEEKTDEEKRKKEFSSLMHDHSSVLEAYGEKADKLMRAIQDSFEKDYTSFCVGAGALAVIASVILSVLDKSPTFAITLLVLGFISIISGVVLKSVSSKSKIEHLPKIIELEKERAQVQLREKLYQRMWLKGMPEYLDNEQMKMLLGNDLTLNKTSVKAKGIEHKNE